MVLVLKSISRDSSFLKEYIYSRDNFEDFILLTEITADVFSKIVVISKVLLTVI